MLQGSFYTMKCNLFKSAHVLCCFSHFSSPEYALDGDCNESEIGPCMSYINTFTHLHLRKRQSGNYRPYFKKLSPKLLSNS